MLGVVGTKLRFFHIDPVSKLLLAIEVGDRGLEMAQHLVHSVASVLAPRGGADVCDRPVGGVWESNLDSFRALGRDGERAKWSYAAALDARRKVGVCTSQETTSAAQNCAGDDTSGVWQQRSGAESAENAGSQDQHRVH